MKTIIAIIFAGILLVGGLVYSLSAQTRAQNVVQIIVVPGGHYDQVVIPPGEIVGFSCAAGVTDVQPDCYILIK